MRLPESELFITYAVDPNLMPMRCESAKQSLTNGDDEGHAEELPPERPLDLVEEVGVGGAQVPQDQPELGQRPVERVVVDLDHLVPLLKTHSRNR